MSYFTSGDQANRVFTDLFAILVEDDTFRDSIERAGLSLELIQTDPDVRIFVDSTGVGSDPRPTAPNIRIKMSCDTAHRLWSGSLLMPVAVATGRVRIKGSVPKVLELVPILEPAFTRYSGIAERHGVLEPVG